MVKQQLDCNTDLGKKGYGVNINKLTNPTNCNSSNVNNSRSTIGQLEEIFKETSNINSRKTMGSDNKSWSEYSNILGQNNNQSNLSGTIPLDSGTQMGKNNYDAYHDKSNLFDDPTMLDNKLNDLDDHFFLALENFKDSFVRFIQNPKYTENQKIYRRDKDAIVKYEQEAFLLDNDIQVSYDKINSLIKEQDKKNAIAKKTNNDLMNKMKNTNSSDSSVHQMIGDKEYEYRIIYTKSALFIAGSVGLIVYALKAFKTNRN